MKDIGCAVIRYPGNRGMTDQLGGRALVRRLVLFILWLACVDSHGMIQHQSDEDHSHDHRGQLCGTEVPTMEEEAINQVRVDAFQEVTDGTYLRRRKLVTESCHELCDQCIEIETYLHMIGTDLPGVGPVIPHPTPVYESAKKNIAGVTIEKFSTRKGIESMFEENIEVLNKAFKGTPFRFKFIHHATTRTTNTDWVEDAAEHMEEMSRVLGNDDLRKLDVYLSATLRSGSAGEVLGTATLPGSQQMGKGDGVYLRYDVLPNGGRPKNDMGYALVHEVGHVSVVFTYRVSSTASSYFSSRTLPISH